MEAGVSEEEGSKPTTKKKWNSYEEIDESAVRCYVFPEYCCVIPCKNHSQITASASYIFIFSRSFSCPYFPISYS